MNPQSAYYGMSTNMRPQTHWIPCYALCYVNHRVIFLLRNRLKYLGCCGEIQVRPSLNPFGLLRSEADHSEHASKVLHVPILHVLSALIADAPLSRQLGESWMRIYSQSHFKSV